MRHERVTKTVQAFTFDFSFLALHFICLSMYSWFFYVSRNFGCFSPIFSINMYHQDNTNSKHYIEYIHIEPFNVTVSVLEHWNNCFESNWFFSYKKFGRLLIVVVIPNAMIRPNESHWSSKKRIDYGLYRINRLKESQVKSILWFHWNFSNIQFQFQFKKTEINPHRMKKKLIIFHLNHIWKC